MKNLERSKVCDQSINMRILSLFAVLIQAGALANARKVSPALQSKVKLHSTSNAAAEGQSSSVFKAS